MRTRTLTFPEFGLEKAEWIERELPVLADDHIRVKVLAISLNYRDLLMVEGLYNPRVPRPLVPCSDACAQVLQVGSKVQEFKVGDLVITQMVPGWQDGPPPENAHHRTLGGPAAGVCCDFQDFQQDALIKVPAQWNPKHAACLPVAGLTAWNAIRSLPKWRSPAWVLTLGTGGVSCFAAQIAKKLGMRVVMTSSSDQKLTRLAQLHDVGINYRATPAWDKEVLTHCPQGVDGVIEVGGAGTFNRSVNATRLGGCIALIGVLADPDQPPNLTKALMKDIRIQGILVGNHKRAQEFIQFLQDNPIEPIIDKVFDGLDSIPSAFAYLKTGQHVGKVVIDLT